MDRLGKGGADSQRLCTDLQTLIQERAQIEKGYTKNLRAWSKKWGELIEKGDIFEKLEDEDEQAWCKGRKNGKVGLYPANYVENVAT